MRKRRTSCVKNKAPAKFTGSYQKKRLRKKHTSKVINLKFEYNILLSSWIIGENFKFLLFEDPQILGRFYKSSRHLLVHNIIENSSINLGYRVCH